MTLKRSLLNSRNLVFNEINSSLFADIQARSQKFPIRGAILGVWGPRPQPPKARGSEGGAPSAQKFCIFLQKLPNFKTILIKNNAFKTWHKKLAEQHDLSGCINGLCGRWLMITL